MSDKLPVNIPDDLKLSSDQELQDLETNVLEEFNSLREGDDVTPETLERLQALADGLEKIRIETRVRTERAAAELAAEQQKYTEQRDRLVARVNGPQEPAEGEEPAAKAETDTEAIVAAAAQGFSQAIAPLLEETKAGKRAGLAEARRHAPAISSAPKATLNVTAGVDIPGLARGGELSNLEAMADAFHRQAKIMNTARSGKTEGPTVATIRNDFDHTIDNRTPLEQVGELFQFLTAKDKQEALVAGGGWCAPSEVRYDFFNIACEDGLIDLPTFGVSRGGIRWPISPSLADAGLALAAISNTTQPWLWTEDDDEAAVTGAPVKPCIRVPCPDFDERRLECYGICLTAGNLTDDAYPENTQNFLRLLLAAHAHAMNARTISVMESLSSALVTGGAFAAGGPAFPALLNGVALAATDYRTRYGMCDDDVLEVVIPNWIVGVMTSSLLRRSGVDPDELLATKERIRTFFAARNVRVQFVGDWQVRGAGQFGAATPMTAWPGSVDIMLYAAGTFLMGNGLQLNLGVVRDSVLNETNDHTAAWSEECHLVARVGHEARRYRIGYSVLGDTCCETVADPL